MFALQDTQGRKVVVQEREKGKHLVAVDGTEEFPVKEAVVVHFNGKQADDQGVLIPDEEFFNKMFQDAGFDPKAFGFFPNRERGYTAIEINMNYRYDGYSWSNPQRARTRTCTVNGRQVDEATYDKLGDVIRQMRAYEWLRSGHMHLVPWSRDRADTGRVEVNPMIALELIGVGKTVTMDSLSKACAKDETRPRLWPGDMVEVKMARKSVTGTITGLGKKVSVLRSDSKKGSYVYASVSITDKVAFDEDALADLDGTLKANFDYVLSQAHRIYKASVTVRESVKFPAFPGPDDNDWDKKSVTNAPTCECPLCGWPMADFDNRGEFQCCFCRVRGIVAHQDPDTVTLLMLRQPAKNRFAIREAKCCGNCGLFHFEYGRQGKRSTGYCQATNQCVQAHSTCVGADGDDGYWFPRPPAEYSKQMTQHVTNLGYGVSDSRNTTRRDIRDTIYREEDHKEQRERADVARKAYAAAYAKFMADLGEMAQGRAALTDEFTDEQKAELRQHFQQVLDEGC